ncbi:hypothetical protein MUB24_14980 [Lederbergia sp. NSJ-179]|uniref:hypothetical protein n=1 Tax=Lederbergia sp. NSJ-179 TaxID=2931402 RepID=UPI001FD0316D|nr:hypothetical protein [Lederbergia sp. NSJ-179]MCJ7842182.1 hypothetical protein [Lederbergia sp. NSJ-179]
MNNPIRDQEIIYVHMNHSDRFVISSGISFSDFIDGISVDLSNLLLIRHKFEEGHFNMHMLLDYVDQDMLKKISAAEVKNYGDFCWIDFTDEEQLNQLSGQEIAEILYMGHFKDHLKQPFYRKLGNQFVYLTGDDGWLNKTYYQSWEPFFTMLGSVIAKKMMNQREIGFLNFRKKRRLSPIPGEILHSFMDDMKEGIVISLGKSNRNRSVLEIPIWLVGDFYDMDTMTTEYELIMETNQPDGKLVLDRKTGEWQALTKYVVK